LIMPKDLSFNDKNRQEQIQQIASLLNIPENEIQNILSPYPKNFKYYVTAKENIDYEEALLLKIKSQGVSGLYIETRNEREYLFPHEFSHILGYEGKITEDELKEKSTAGYLLNDYLGKTGIELSYEDILRGKYGEEGIEVDVTGQAIKVLYHQDAQNGKNLILTIDWEVQKKIREILQNYLKQYNKSRASAIMLNPQNGEVIALVSLPDFDSNLFAGGISSEEYKKLVENEDNPLFNRSIKGEYPSGSSIKPAIALAALQEKIVTDKTTFLSTGGLWLYDRWFFPDWSANGHGLTNIYKAIAWSVNTYFYIIGGGYNDIQGLGTDNLEKYLKAFGFGDKTGIDLAGESTGLVPTPVWKMKTKNEQWYIGDTYHLAIGQGDFLATPLQIANYTACIANGGTLYEPHLVKEIMPNQGDSEIINPKILRDNFIDRENIDIVKRAMRQTVTIGSAQSLNNLSIAVAGKTGTAQWHPDKNNHAWFTGFAPYENPEVAITILVEEGGEGSSVSVPIAANILNWYFNEYQPKLK
jgi:penicillin-binding protein 2